MTVFEIKLTSHDLLVSTASRYASKVLSFGFTRKVFINSKTFSEMFVVNTATRLNLAYFIIFYLTLHQKELL